MSDPSDQGRHVGRRSIWRNASALTASVLVARLSAFAFGIVLARILGAEEFGRYSFALALGIVLQPLADFGLQPYLGREMARRRAPTEAALPVIVAVKLVLGAVVYAVVITVAVATVEDRGLLTAVAVLVLAALVDGASILIYGYFQGLESMSFEAWVGAVAALVRNIGGLAVAVAFQQLQPVALWILMVSVAQFLCSSAKLSSVVGGWRRLRPRSSTGRVEWRSVTAMGLMTIFVTAYLRIDTVLLAWLAGERATGIYAAAYAILMGVQLLSSIVAAALTPVFARTYATDLGEFERTWRNGARTLLITMLPVALVINLLADPVIALAYGDEFVDSAAVLRIFIWICPFVALSLVVQAVLRGARREASLTWISGICALANVLANLWAIPRFGIFGAAWVTLGTEIANTLILLGVGLRAGLVNLPRLPVLRIAVALGMLAAVVRFLRAPFEIVGVVALCAYVGALVLTRVLGVRDLAVLRRIVRRQT